VPDRQPIRRAEIGEEECVRGGRLHRGVPGRARGEGLTATHEATVSEAPAGVKNGRVSAASLRVRTLRDPQAIARGGCGERAAIAPMRSFWGNSQVESTHGRQFSRFVLVCPACST
jgi:hypothetical protein